MKNKYEGVFDSAQIWVWAPTWAQTMYQVAAVTARKPGRYK